MAKQTKVPTKQVAAVLSQPHDYAIVAIIKGHRYYWNHDDERWTDWYNATHFSKEQRKAYKLPKESYWVTVLHGMGRNNYYAADSELKSA